MNKLSIIDIIYDTTVDGPGFRTSIYSAGCNHCCKGCHNPYSWNKKNGTSYSVIELFNIIKENDFANVTFSGGDPLVQVDGFTELAKMIKQETKKTIWCYTGFLYEQIIRSDKLYQILPFIDVLVDGKFEQKLYEEGLQFRGSSNQRIIDVQNSLAQHKIVLWDNKSLDVKDKNLFKQYTEEVLY